MKLTKTIALAALVAGGLLAGTAASPAQDHTNSPPAHGPGLRGRPNLDQIATDLDLTADQKAKVKAVLDEQQTKRQALQEDTSLTPEDKRAKNKELREATQAKLKEILTADQWEQWQKRMQRNRPPGGPGGTPPPSAPPKE